MNSFQVGTAKIDITPSRPIPLSGFGHRRGCFEGIIRSLFARLFLFQQKNVQLLLITADLIWWGDELVERMRRTISKQFGISAENLLFHATHNHSGPQTSERVLSSLGVCDARYLNKLEMKIYEGIKIALADLEPVKIQIGRGKWSESINRRRNVDGEWRMAPNPDGVNDPEVTAIQFYTINDSQEKENRVKAVLIHTTCHPTVSDENWISSEFPGYAMEVLEKDYGSRITAGFLQGFCGDIRPALIKEDSFYRGNDSDVKRIGDSLAREVIRVLQTKDCMRDLQSTCITVDTITAELKTSQRLSIEELKTLRNESTLTSVSNESSVVSEWAKRMLDDPNRLQASIPLEVKFVRLARGLSFLFTNAEMVVEYGLHVKKLFKHEAIPIGYTNGIIGYVPTARQLEEGGYEPRESVYYFTLPAPFDPSIEADVCSAFLRVFERRKQK